MLSINDVFPYFPAPNDVFPYFPAGQSAQCVAAEALAYVPAPHRVHVIEIGLSGPIAVHSP